MKLRYSFSSRQCLFALGFGLCALCFTNFNALAQDKIVTANGRAQNTKILGVSGANIQVQVGSGVVGIPLASVASVVMAPPAEVAEAQKAFAARDYPKALALVQAVAAKYMGLPVAWACQNASLLGDIHVELGQLKEAEAAYNAFRRAYPKAGSVQVDVGMARIALSRKAYDEASAKLEPIAAKARENPLAPSPDAVAYSQTFLLLGEIAEARSQPVAALENYLRTVTIFYRDANSVQKAQERADALRKQDPSLALP